MLPELILLQQITQPLASLGSTERPGSPLLSLIMLFACSLSLLKKRNDPEGLKLKLFFLPMRKAFL